MIAISEDHEMPDTVSDRERNHARAQSTVTAGCVMELLQPRTMLSAVSWDGGAGDSQWGSPQNWSNDVVPVAGDDVTIDVASNPTIHVSSGAFELGSLVTRENLVLEGGRLKLGTTAQIDGAISIAIQGGELAGGVLSYLNGGTLALTTGGGTLRDVTTNTDLLLNAPNKTITIAGSTSFSAARLMAGGTTLSIETGYTLTSLISSEGEASGVRTVLLAAGGPGPVTIGPTGIIRSAAGSFDSLSLSNASAATLTNNGLISAEAKSININVSAFTNNATVQAKGATLNVQSGTMAGGAGASWLTTGANARMQIAAPTWSNSGAFTLIDGTLTLAGSCRTSDLQLSTFSRSGTLSKAILAGLLDNSNAVLALNAQTGSWQLAGGTITGGAVTYASSAALILTQEGGTLVDVGVAGELNTVLSAGLFLRGTTTFTTLRMSGGSCYVSLAPGYVLNSLISVEISTGQGVGTITIADGGSGVVRVGPSGSIRLVGTSNYGVNIVGSANGTLRNDGLISIENANRVATIQGVAFVNNGTTQVLGGTLDILTASMTGSSSAAFIASSGTTLRFGAASWSNAGSLTMDSATLTLAGTFSTAGFNFNRFARNAGTVNLVGTLVNTEQTLRLNAMTGSWTLAGGTIFGGALTYSGGSSLLATTLGGRLNGVAIDGDLVLNTTSANVTLQGATTFSAVRLIGNSVTLNLSPGYVLSSLVSIEGPFPSTRTIVVAYGAAGTVTFDPSAIVRIDPASGGGLTIRDGSVAALVNNGLIQGSAVGKALTIQASSFTNNGTVDAAGSAVILGSGIVTNISAGMLAGGVWKASAAGYLSGQSGLVSVLNANVILDGASKGWDALSALTTIVAGATLQISGGTGQSIAPVGGSLTNDGTLVLGVGSTLSITGGFVQTANGDIQAQIAGGDPNSSYGSVVATGPSTLDGSLHVVAVSGYLPARPDVQDIVRSTDTVSGVFSSVLFPQPGNPDWTTALIYTGSGARLITTSIIDFNFDGQIDLQDYFEFFNRWDMSDPRLDLNHDGTVDLGDFFQFFNLFDVG